jgi:hypothetical protein
MRRVKTRTEGGTEQQRAEKLMGASKSERMNQGERKYRARDLAQIVNLAFELNNAILKLFPSVGMGDVKKLTGQRCT